MKKTFAATLVAACALGATVSQAATPEVEALLQAAQKEGAVYSVGMPNTWANWVKTWNDLQTKYKIKTQDTDMASAEQISKFMAEGENATSDIGDVGFEFGEIAKKRGITMPYKPSTWDQIPGWAKDPDGHWCLAYTGTVAFIINKELVKDIPRTWSDLLKGTYRVSVGAVVLPLRPTTPCSRRPLLSVEMKRISIRPMTSLPRSQSRDACRWSIRWWQILKRAKWKSACCGTSMRSTIAIRSIATALRL